MIINPQKHRDAVHTFLNYFDIKPCQPQNNYIKVILAHFSVIPYENISKIVKLSHHFTTTNRLRLPEEVMEDHIRYGLGGTCFSMTFFLQTILASQGFMCYPVIANMRNRPNSHCALIVFLEQQKHLVDPGYLLNNPVKLDKDNPRFYRTPHSGIELGFNPLNDCYYLKTFNNQESRWRYYFNDHPLSEQEFLQYWLDSFYKSSMHSLCLVQSRRDGLLYLNKNILQTSSFSRKQKQKIDGQYQQIIHQHFGINPEIVEQALAAIIKNKEQQKKLGLYTKYERAGNIETD